MALQLLPTQLLAHLHSRSSTDILRALKALRSRNRLLKKQSVLDYSSHVVRFRHLLFTAMILSTVVPSVICYYEAPWRRASLLGLLPPSGVAEHARSSLRGQLILNEAELLVLLKLILEFLKLEILLRELLGTTDRRHVGACGPRLLHTLMANLIRELLGRAYLYSEALATLATRLPLGRTRAVSCSTGIGYCSMVAVRVHRILILFYF